MYHFSHTPEVMVLKDMMLSLRLTAADLQRLDELKNETGMSRGEIVRELIGRARIDPRPRLMLQHYGTH